MPRKRKALAAGATRAASATSAAHDAIMCILLHSHKSSGNIRARCRLLVLRVLSKLVAYSMSLSRASLTAATAAQNFFLAGFLTEAFVEIVGRVARNGMGNGRYDGELSDIAAGYAHLVVSCYVPGLR